jgi:uncharacterized protein YjbI with pentapeptide repeats
MDVTAFNGADLTRADFTGAAATTSAFASAVFSRTICPDATNSDDNGGSCAGHGL